MTDFGRYCNHEIAIKNEVQRLENKGYKCEREYVISLDNSKDKRKGLFVDIRATRGQEELLIEVGTLSKLYCEDFFDDRILLLKHLRPNAKIIHILQWKNFFTVYDFQNEKVLYRAKMYALKVGKNLTVRAINEGLVTDGLEAYVLAHSSEKEEDRFEVEDGKVIWFEEVET